MSVAEWLKAKAQSFTALRIANIFHTIDGETNQWHAGSWSVFIRLQGCRVGCVWCDTKHTWDPRKGVLMTPEEIFQRVRVLAPQVYKVTITGGEPMEQMSEVFGQLLNLLLTQHYSISMETAGTHDLRPMLEFYPELNYIVDYKLPSAQARQVPHADSFYALRPTDVIKFCATTLQEVDLVYKLALHLRNNGCRARMVLSPVLIPASLHTLSHFPQTLHEFVEHARDIGLPALDVGINLQLHKFIWTENARDEERASLPVNTPPTG